MKGCGEWARDAGLPPDAPPAPIPPRSLATCRPCQLTTRHKESNPEGWIPLVIAENKLSGGAVLERLEAVRGFPPETMNYARYGVGGGGGTSAQLLCPLSPALLVVSRRPRPLRAALPRWPPRASLWQLQGYP